MQGVLADVVGRQLEDFRRAHDAYAEGVAVAFGGTTA